jgi:predicted 3-demethylubiquinone-9 3-methyltransferase (glyoxalase superfamily)
MWRVGEAARLICMGAMSLRVAPGLHKRPPFDERTFPVPAITPCLWFDTQGEDAAALYTSVFPNSRILDVTRYNEAGPREAGTVMTVLFELDGKRFLALNGGPDFTFSEAISFQIDCADQDEVDHYWDALSAGGEEGPCGWLKDRFGVSWQVVPKRLPELLSDPSAAQRVMDTMFTMRKLDIARLEEASAAHV